MTSSIFGSVVHRTEDPRFLLGRGRYTDALVPDGALRAAFIRSMMPHARLGRVDTSEALSMPGVLGAFTARDLGLPPIPPSGSVPSDLMMPILADEVVRYVGEAVAVLVAETSAQAEDAAELVLVDYEPLPSVVGVEAALAPDARPLFPGAGSNEVGVFSTDWDADVLEGADVVARGRFVNQRLAPVPMEANAIVAIPDEEGGLTLLVSTQIPFDVRNDVADALGIERDLVRAIAPDVGGGFGAKLVVYPEFIVVAAIAHRLGRVVAWTQTRSESMVALTHGRAQVQAVEIGARWDGTIVGVRAEIWADMGAYPIGAYLPSTTAQMISGVYRIPRLASRGHVVLTNATPVSTYRGAGRPEATALIERAVDLLALELEMDPAEVRRRNLIPSDGFPYMTATGSLYDSGDYREALDLALTTVGYDRLRAEQVERRARSDRLLLGIGISTYVEITAFAGREFGSIEVDTDGTVTVLTGVSPHGQGHETSLAQLVSALLGVAHEDVRVVHSDTALVPRGNGTYASRSLQLGGSAVWRAGEEVVAKARAIAAHLLEAAEEDVTLLDDGRIGIAGAPDTALSWADVATAAREPERLPEGMEPGLAASVVFRQKDSTFPFGAHVAVVEVDTQTGDARLIRHVAIDDCGRILNPMLVEGQVHGGLAQGIAQALYEGVEYDELGTPLTVDLTTYRIPSAADLPTFERGVMETPTPLNPLGVKGIGEAATIGSTPAVQNAIVDAVSHLGVRHVDMPLTPERVWRAMRAASEDRRGAR